MEGTEVFAILSVFGFFGFLAYMFYSTRHRERMALIESGQDAGIFRGISRRLSALKWGLVLTMIGLGLGTGIYIDYNNNHDGPIVTFPMVFCFAGIGLLIFYFLTKDHEEIS